MCSRICYQRSIPLQIFRSRCPHLVLELLARGAGVRTVLSRIVIPEYVATMPLLLPGFFLFTAILTSETEVDLSISNPLRCRHAHCETGTPVALVLQNHAMRNRSYLRFFHAITAQNKFPKLGQSRIPITL